MSGNDIEEELAAALLADSSLLSKDTIPDSNQSLTCFSCGAVMVGLYCKECGQKNDNLRRSLFGMGWEAFTSLFAFENRIWRTWLNLFTRPGKVGREYCDGRRSYWTSPVRIYIFMSIILFGFLSLTGRQFISIDAALTPRDISEQDQAEMEPHEQYDFKWQIRYFEKENDIKARAETMDINILRAKVNSFMGTGSSITLKELRETAQTGIPPDTSESNAFTITDVAGQTRTIKNSDVAERFVQLVRDPAQVNAALNKWLPRIIFFMIPFSMLIGAIFIRGKDALLYDHIVHAAYIHAVTFLALLIGIILSGFIPGGVLAKAILIGILIYLPLSLKGMFGRGWFKTLFASYSVAALYLLLISILVTVVVTSAVIGDMPHSAA